MAPREFKAHIDRITKHLRNGNADLAHDAFWKSAELMTDKQVSAMMQFVAIKL
jgi:predicted metal-dependent hydrolase